MTTKQLGRPKKSMADADHNAEIDRLLVEGELVEDDDGKKTRVYPMAIEIAARLGVSPSWVSKFAKKNRCAQRRAVLQAKVSAKAQEKLIERESSRLAFDTERSLSLCDKVLGSYEELIAQHGVTTFSAGDLNTVVRLRRFLQGDADSRQEVTSSITLETLQGAHRQMLTQMRDMTPEECGIESDDGPVPGTNPPMRPFDGAGLESEVDPEMNQIDPALNVREAANPDIGEPTDPAIGP